MSRLRFGIFMAPFHAKVGQNPTTAFQRDIETIQLLDRLGYDEAWLGEHHSCGAELIASPEIFIGHVAAKTEHIRLGTGVLSLPYHNPLWVADRALLLDHLTRGRFMLGLGPGALPTDAAMIGIDPSEQRPALEEDTDVLMQLLTTDEPVTHKTARYNLVDARCQLMPYSDPCFEIGVAAIASPSGPRIAGKHGLSLLSVGATLVGDLDLLALHWDVVEEEAARHGKPCDRSGWRLVGPMHIAETREQALRDVEYGIEDWFDYLQKTAAAPQFHPLGDTLEERIAWVNESGVGLIGTPDDAVAMIDTMYKQSNGGFGAYLMMAHEWARPDAVRRHYELFADQVMPKFQRSADRTLAAERYARSRWDELNSKQADALQAATDRYAEERKSRT
ncbi:LLM class flavin-dependent oxidoreductase [Pseudonocardia endophytica]|uniref:Limonene 1,2-monooxygenase n=1 Tax=Pseudonocardia endophytica TaxID=401976 RepID=A0A4R1HUV9_PSEEN|nr:LLM class flavin-dependent oxidoreductase [Pseudonocardia endophytica]TCK25191.1 limonene 1,2-monooxygenase [Pseudonocardia endophytica]